jgi:hypothetical protein
MHDERRWNSDEYHRARAEGDQIERLMRSILKLFADGCLVYRDREVRASSVQTKSDRLRRLRNAEELALEGGAAVLG